jgi:hypothetical protein
MTKGELVKLGFNKVLIEHIEDMYVSNNYYYELSFGELVFISGDKDQADNDDGWYVTTPCHSLKFHHFAELETVINIFKRNKFS